MINSSRTVLFLLLFAFAVPLFAAQKEDDIIIDYNNPQKYIVGGVSVEGNTYFAAERLINLSGIREGMEVDIPGEGISSVVKRLWMQRYFEDVAVAVDSITPTKDTVFLKICIKERPRVSRITFTGVKTSEQKDLQERLNIRRGEAFSDYVSKTSADIIKRYYKEKGFLLTEVDVQTKKDTVVKGAIRVNFAINKGSKVKIKKITFTGNDHVKETKLVRSMKKTKDARLLNFFNSKKFDENEYDNDKRGLVSAFNEAGFRDARIVKDTMYYIEPNRLQIDFTIDEGKQYYFRDITWTGNSVYASDVLNEILSISKGDVYDVVTMEKRLYGGGKQNEYDITKLYRDNGYLFFQIQPVEMNIQGDSVDVEMRIVEGKPARLNNIIINGNDL